MMTDILKFEADMITLQVIYNSIGNQEFGDTKRTRSSRAGACNGEEDTLSSVKVDRVL